MNEARDTTCLSACNGLWPAFITVKWSNNSIKKANSSLSTSDALVWPFAIASLAWPRVKSVFTPGTMMNMCSFGCQLVISRLILHKSSLLDSCRLTEIVLTPYTCTWRGKTNSRLIILIYSCILCKFCWHKQKKRVGLSLVDLLREQQGSHEFIALSSLCLFCIGLNCQKLSHMYFVTSAQLLT